MLVIIRETARRTASVCPCPIAAQRSLRPAARRRAHHVAPGPVSGAGSADSVGKLAHGRTQQNRSWDILDPVGPVGPVSAT